MVIIFLCRRIHEPVPLFNKEILKPVNAFMNRITPNKPFWRANWTVSLERIKAFSSEHVCSCCVPYVWVQPLQNTTLDTFRVKVFVWHTCAAI